MAFGKMRRQLSVGQQNYVLALAHPFRTVMTRRVGSAPSATASTAGTCYIASWPHVALDVVLFRRGDQATTIAWTAATTAMAPADGAIGCIVIQTIGFALPART